ncbi:hypothetical protein ASPZODRAFT_16661 [Penicilliopsis zonata CBS 506.65]|uniref:Myb-like domain-containing protein n=1 Tax=Penicilliopsis zonata CBS 506.65 TaxID=1073090 RepID=A0A1L9SFX8_9EURO|nr:hypothetical protein ASPZODRAFT_16661 [Penicilliopsis zonata CBS 506.65]OJJ46066.1 hypothetical protein ASPZODRAFT_16661 [Penicilliopsis zonata CBS 506.65]
MWTTSIPDAYTLFIHPHGLSDIRLETLGFDDRSWTPQCRTRPERLAMMSNYNGNNQKQGMMNDAYVPEEAEFCYPWSESSHGASPFQSKPQGSCQYAACNGLVDFSRRPQSCYSLGSLDQPVDENQGLFMFDGEPTFVESCFVPDQSFHSAIYPSQESPTVSSIMTSEDDHPFCMPHIVLPPSWTTASSIPYSSKMQASSSDGTVADAPNHVNYCFTPQISPSVDANGLFIVEPFDASSILPIKNHIDRDHHITSQVHHWLGFQNQRPLAEQQKTTTTAIAPQPQTTETESDHKPDTSGADSEREEHEQDPSSPCTDTRNAFLIDCKRRGMSYKDIKRLGGFREAESTLRGRFRTLTKAKDQRVRKPKWQERDVHLLCQAVDSCDPGCYRRCMLRDRANLPKISWKSVAQYIWANGGSYHFGNATCKKKWYEIHGVRM